METNKYALTQEQLKVVDDLWEVIGNYQKSKDTPCIIPIELVGVISEYAEEKDISKTQLIHCALAVGIALGGIALGQGGQHE